MVNKLNLPASTDVVERIRWHINVRWVLVIVYCMPLFIAISMNDQTSIRALDLSMVLTIGVLSNIAFSSASRVRRGNDYQRRISLIALVSDIILISLVIYLLDSSLNLDPTATSQLYSSFSPEIFYVVPLIIAAATLGRLSIYLAAITSLLAYSFTASLAYNNTEFLYMRPKYVYYAVAIAVIAFCIDSITRLLIEKEKQAIKKGESLIRAQSIAGIGSWEWDIPSNTVFWSDELYRIFDLQAIGKKATLESYLERVHPDDRKLVSDSIKQAVENKKPFKFEHRTAVMPNPKYVLTEGQVMLDKKGGSEKLVGIAQDVTAERQLERAKSEFVSLASHQLRTPATGVKAFIALLSDGYAGKLNEKQLHFLSNAYKANERQLTIINDLLNVASIESGRIALKKTHVDIIELIKSIAEEYKPQAIEKKQKLTLGLPESPLYAEIDEARFKMILDNLLSNAKKYTPEKGHINIRVVKTSKNIFIHVKDSGSGISKKDLSKLFAKFSRIDNPKNIDIEGSGLGLYLAKYLAKLHDGDILVKSKLNHGSTFTIKIPVFNAPTKHKKGKSTSQRVKDIILRR
jgi:nitrogen-specific signal transduction histidine kinase